LDRLPFLAGRSAATAATTTCWSYQERRNDQRSQPQHPTPPVQHFFNSILL